MAIIRMVFAFIISFNQIITPCFQLAIKGGEKAFFEDWSADKPYTMDYAAELKKSPDKDFVILNITDIQFKDGESYGKGADFSYATIEKLIEDAKPDLITVTGDNAWGTMAYIRLVKEFESYNIPWAPVMGNHDGQNCISEFWCAYLLANAKNCLFKFGPADMGYGNYVINITENGKIVHTIYMMDTHSNAGDTPAGEINGTEYDGLWANQFEWYKWAVEGTKKLAGNNVESSIFIHIPLYQYRTAWKLAYDEETHAFRDEYKDNAFGVNHEGIYSPNADNGFFDIIKELDSTKTVVCGHEHVNDFSIEYEGVRLTYSVKCGPGCYWEKELNGGTKLCIDSKGDVALEHIFIAPEELGYSF